MLKLAYNMGKTAFEADDKADSNPFNISSVSSAEVKFMFMGIPKSEHMAGLIVLGQKWKAGYNDAGGDIEEGQIRLNFRKDSDTIC